MRFPACKSLVTERLKALGFEVFEHLGDEDICFVLRHPQGSECKIPKKLLESYREVGEKVKAVLGHYISSLSKGLERMIRAEAWSDCQQLRVKFDATRWAEQASDEQLIELGECGFRGDYPADDVALFMADHDLQAASLFEFLQVVQTQPYSGDTNGFECEVDADDLRLWLQENRPHLVEQVFAEN